ncbi:Glyoxylase, beta-lactamase superfamily II [Methylomagnum ishizawai]|uniref:Glyoxylase, beta-lactamase superfamily II n=1 Tax=Methylomagnum ishizawai TaxID=1760988 RepID=A0A1Y6D1C6_9GAMM|nr:MBL fold metallo-hydrolase [Methylomagnum ishizawai]SMF96729.1 Glyoxylase, beta-lactamase superfamily II [Methylomagnum ishizawai]
MKALIVPVTAFQQNCTLLWCERTLEGVVIDPGGDLDLILEEARTAGVKLVKILLTHAHIDHAGGTAELAERLGLPVEGPQRLDDFWIKLLPQQSRMFGFPPVPMFTPDRWLDQGDTVEFGGETLEVLHCPGHTPGHVVFFHRGERLAVVGDVLFQGSIGRTDFPQGDHATLLKSIRERLFPLGEDVVFIPGHGPVSSFGEEMRHNPYVGVGME